MKCHSIPLLWFILLLLASTASSTVSDEENLGRLPFHKFKNHREIQCVSFNNNELIFSFDEEMVRIDVRLSDLVENLTLFAKQHPHIVDDATLLSTLSDSSRDFTSDELESHIKQRALFRIEDLLIQGKARVYSKKENLYLESYMTANYDYYAGPLTAGGGKIFFFKGTNIVFLVVLGWIS